jgi:hypothetical protein
VVGALLWREAIEQGSDALSGYFDSSLGVAVDRSIKDARRVDPVVPQGRKEYEHLPAMTTGQILLLLGSGGLSSRCKS